MSRIRMKHTNHTQSDTIPAPVSVQSDFGGDPRRVPGRIASAGKQQGQALVELALIVPFLLLLTAGMIELGRAFLALGAAEAAAYRAFSFAAFNRVNALDTDSVRRAVVI